MRLAAAALIVAALVQDPPAKDGGTIALEAGQALGQKKGYAFTIKTAIDGDAAIKNVLDTLEQDLTGVLRNDGVCDASAEDVRCVRNGGDALFEVNKKWRTRDEVTKLYKDKSESPTRLFDTLDNPHDEIGGIRERVEGLEPGGAEAVDGADCDKLSGKLTPDGAQLLAKTFFGRMRVKGGGRKGRGRSAEPVGAAGTATIWLGKDGLPRKLEYALKFQVNAGSTPFQATLTRTCVISKIDEAKLDVPFEVRKRLNIAE